MTNETASTNATAPTFERRPADTAPAISTSLRAIAMALAMAGVAPPPPKYSRTFGGNVTVIVQDWDLSGAIVSAIAALHERLLARSAALPTEAARVLYSNLWDLYVD